MATSCYVPKGHGNTLPTTTGPQRPHLSYYSQHACFRLQSSQHVSTSSDGTVTVPATPGGSKKSNQHK